MGEKPLISEVLMGLLWAGSQITKTRSRYQKNVSLVDSPVFCLRCAIVCVLTAPTLWLIVSRGKAAHLTKHNRLQCYGRHDATRLNAAIALRLHWDWESQTNNTRQKKKRTLSNYKGIHRTLKKRKGKKRSNQRQGITYTCVLLDALENVLGRNQEVDEVAQAVSTVRWLHHIQHLAQHSATSGLKWRVERRECALDAAVQRFRVLGTHAHDNHTC